MKKLLLIFLVFILSACTQTVGIDKPETREWKTVNKKRVGIHDPSIIKVEEDGENYYYIFGTHISQAKSKDLINWEVPMNGNGYKNMEDNQIYGQTNENLKETFEWAGYDDADSSGGYNLWAPDLVFNPEYEWKDGSKGAYMYYYSASSTWRRSAIGFMVSDKIEGPYAYVDTIIYSGFTQEDSTDGSDRNINYKNTHLHALIESNTIEGFNEKWTRKLGKEYNTDYAPNALDPVIFYDKEGKMWMNYGSWSGGTFVLQLDEKTGQPIYPGVDGSTADGRNIDRYFGTKISGGYHQSGEGPYIAYDPASDYYYFFLTYGGLAADGGYNMRMFRSENPEGPYVDARGNRPIFSSGESNENYGIKLIGNHRINNGQQGYKSAGHNSVLIEEDRKLLVFHTRFPHRGEEFEVRIHEMLSNKEGWLTPLPTEYDGKVEEEEIKEGSLLGSYEIVNHGKSNSGSMIESEEIILNEDHSVGGALRGHWKLEEGIYLTIESEDTKFSGVAVNRQIKNEKTLVFSLIGDNNESIWGIKR